MRYLRGKKKCVNSTPKYIRPHNLYINIHAYGHKIKYFKYERKKSSHAKLLNDYNERVVLNTRIIAPNPSVGWGTCYLTNYW